MSYLHDGKGNKSSARLNVAVWSFGVFAIWACICVYKRELVDIPLGLGVIVGYVVAGKTMQHFAEIK